MKAEYPQTQHTDALGEIDLHYYIAKGKQLRAEAVGQMLQRFLDWLKPARKSAPQRPLKASFRH